MKSDNKLKNYLRYTDSVMLIGLILLAAVCTYLEVLVYTVPFIGGWLTARILLMIGISQHDANSKMSSKNLYINILVYLVVFSIFFYFSFTMFLICFIGLFVYRKIYFLFIQKLYLK